MPNHHTSTIPVSVYLLAFGIFAMISCELQVLGMMPLMARDLDLGIPQVGYLVSLYAAAMATGGPLLTLLLGTQPPKRAIYLLYAIFILGESLGALSYSYGQLVVSRLVTGAVSGAFFGIAIGMCGRLVPPGLAIRAVAIVLAGIMVGTILGLPLASLVGEHYGWRASFWLVVALALLGVLSSAALLPALPAAARISLSQELAAFRNRSLWYVYSTSFCVIGATYAAFSYLVPILTQVAGFASSSVSLLLFVYGIAMLLGNHLVAMLAGRRNILILAIGLVLQILFLSLLALFIQHSWVAVAAVIGLGLVGVSMNPAMVSRIMQLPHGERPLVNTVHASVITLGIMFGSFASGQVLEQGYSLLSPMWVGVAVALVGLLTLMLNTTGKTAPISSAIDRGQEVSGPTPPDAR
ncbi:MFS transporter [Zobellella denitrificans]|uniref:MFS transporter n=1 Tax=Zobellella denitrificans TaxID=347534 RepID=UPI000B8BEF74|nr:MFS transporter [Zobellella denitrificans]OXS15236.1 MFS transporter [Zobellella denitrificans]